MFDITEFVLSEHTRNLTCSSFAHCNYILFSCPKIDKIMSQVPNISTHILDTAKGI